MQKIALAKEAGIQEAVNCYRQSGIESERKKGAIGDSKQTIANNELCAERRGKTTIIFLPYYLSKYYIKMQHPHHFQDNSVANVSNAVMCATEAIAIN